MSHIKNNKIVRAIYNNTGSFLSDLAATIKGVAFFPFMSSFKYIKTSKSLDKTRCTEDCLVLGNGPSLKKAIIDNEVPYTKYDTHCVNLFCMSEFFWVIKPKYYYLIDGAFFAPNWDSQKEKVAMMKETFKKIDWQMYLVIPGYAKNGGLLEDLDNPNVEVLKLNSAGVDGFKFFRNFIYRSRMGMPLCQNVTNFALCSAVNMGYKKIHLYGADFSWMKDMHVGDDNVMYQGESHVYDDSKVVKVTPFIGFKISQVCKAWSMAFYIHEVLCDYAASQKQRIINRTKGSYIDAYERDYNSNF